jgi:hypothetical protein
VAVLTVARTVSTSVGLILCGFVTFCIEIFGGVEAH